MYIGLLIGLWVFFFFLPFFIFIFLVLGHTRQLSGYSYACSALRNRLWQARGTLWNARSQLGFILVSHSQGKRPTAVRRPSFLFFSFFYYFFHGGGNQGSWHQSVPSAGQAPRTDQGGFPTCFNFWTIPSKCSEVTPCFRCHFWWGSGKP